MRRRTENFKALPVEMALEEAVELLQKTREQAAFGYISPLPASIDAFLAARENEKAPPTRDGG